MNEREWTDLSARILSAWPTSRLRAEHLASWYTELRTFSVESVSSAVGRLMRTEDRAPSLARLLTAMPKRTSYEVCPRCHKRPGTVFIHDCPARDAGAFCDKISHCTNVCETCYGA
jgi:hypothetical protein